MVNRLTFHYYPGRSLLHRWDARCKLLGILLIGLQLFQAPCFSLAALSVTLLHDLILRDVLGVDPDAGQRQVEYVHNVPDALAALAGGTYDACAFLNATEVGQVRAVADRGEVMPQKSTYFYPKLLSGLLMRSLD